MASEQQDGLASENFNGLIGRLEVISFGRSFDISLNAHSVKMPVRSLFENESYFLMDY